MNFNADLLFFARLNGASIKMQKRLVGLVFVKCSFHQIKYKVREENKTLSCYEENNDIIYLIPKVSLIFSSKLYNVFYNEDIKDLIFV